MAIPVNLYVDRMSPVQPVRIADIYAVTQDRAASYKEAAAKIGLTPREYTEFQQALGDGNAIYVRLPRRIDAMAGIHRNGHVYALRNVIVAAGTMGWEVALADGTTVIVPRVCGNLSMNRTRAIAARPPVIALRPPVRQPKAVRAAVYVAPPPVVPVTPVIFDEAPVVAVAPPVVPIAAAAPHVGGLPFLALLAPIVGAFHGGGGSPGNTPTVDVPACSAGSTTLGVCKK